MGRVLGSGGGVGAEKEDEIEKGIMKRSEQRSLKKKQVKCTRETTV